MDGWREISRVSTVPFGHSIVPVTALAFDSTEELLWSGDANGRVASYANEGLQKYTRFGAHKTSVAQILVNDRGVLSLGAGNLRMTVRRGLHRFDIGESGAFKNLACMSYTSRGTSEIVVGSRDGGLFKVNVDRGTVVSEIPSEDGYTVMRRGGRLICAGSAKGDIVLIDPVSLQVVRKFPAHSGGIADLDTRDNVLLTCGHTYRGSAYLLDPLLNIYDLRTLRPQPPVPFPAGAGFVRLHPKMSTTCVVSSLAGQMQILDFVNPENAYVNQANISSFVTGLDISPSGDFLALSDGDGTVQVWGTQESSRFTEFCKPTEWPDTDLYPAPAMKVSDAAPLNSVGMPYYRNTLLSAWPPEMVFNAGRRSPPIDPEILASMKTVDFVGFAPFPKKHRRYVTETRPHLSKGHDPKTPKFRSEQEKSGVEAVVPADDEPQDAYRKVEIKYSKFGVQDFDFDYYNHTRHAGLETHMPNAYVNGLLQLYRFTPAVYSYALWHVAGACPVDKCLLCELGFVFDMLVKADGEHCRAYNFLRTFGALPQAAALGLLEEEGASRRSPLGPLVQAFNRFLLERIAVEGRSREHGGPALSTEGLTPPELRLFESVAGVSQATAVRCSICASEAQRRGTSFVVDLVYPKHPLAGNALVGSVSGLGGAGFDKRAAPPPAHVSFCAVLEQSLETRVHTRGWCETCRRYQLLTTTKRVQSLPPVLSLNTAIDSPASRQLWSSPSWLPARVRAHAVGNKLKFTPAGELADDASSLAYDLVGYVAEVNFGNSEIHAVSAVSVAQPDGSRQWFLFNDFLVKPIPEAEALSFGVLWKTPLVVVYHIADERRAQFDQSWKAAMDTSLLYHDFSTAATRQAIRFEYKTLAQDEVPRPGTLVAIDAEFVALHQEETEVRSDGTKTLIRPSRLSLARVSVLRGQPPGEGVAFIDDYITTTDTIVDYLTEFSGIEPGDLDPRTSERTLVPLKFAYKKMWLLLNLGCVFVGHGLANDFRTINIQVPDDQVIDTVNIFFLKSRQRKLSLRFLAWYLLQQNIQTETHDSIEDANTALLLFRKYEEINRLGGPSAFDNLLNEIYNEGRVVNFRPPQTPVDPASPTSLGSPK
ncbi:ubiquitin carboxyl-terminal hydrolase-domain-containing protein [Dipodascopsis tothii]|uniref:ubiquitin carboxyl-terminal hydrolase-domain-containing protein n=1 Tax=Dipodascopsis tothii TaxID=44089 RepID=UPI0034CD5289